MSVVGATAAFVGFLTAFILMVGAGAALVFASDRRRGLGKTSQVDPAWSTSVTLPTSGEIAKRLAERALTMIGCKSIAHPDTEVIVGWIGRAWTNVPRYQQYEVVVRYTSNGSNETLVECSARPRFATAIFGVSRAQKLQERVCQEIASLGGPGSVT